MLFLELLEHVLFDFILSFDLRLLLVFLLLQSQLPLGLPGHIALESVLHHLLLYLLRDFVCCFEVLHLFLEDAFWRSFSFEELAPDPVAVSPILAVFIHLGPFAAWFALEELSLIFFLFDIEVLGALSVRHPALPFSFVEILIGVCAFAKHKLVLPPLPVVDCLVLQPLDPLAMSFAILPLTLVQAAIVVILDALSLVHPISPLTFVPASIRIPTYPSSVREAVSPLALVLGAIGALLDALFVKQTAFPVAFVPLFLVLPLVDSEAIRLIVLVLAIIITFIVVVSPAVSMLHAVHEISDVHIFVLVGERAVAMGLVVAIHLAFVLVVVPLDLLVLDRLV